MITMQPFEDNVLNAPLFTDSGWEKGLETGLEENLKALGIHYPSHITFEDDEVTETISWDGFYHTTNRKGLWKNLKDAVTAMDDFPERLNDNSPFHFDASIESSPEVEKVEHGRAYMVNGDIFRASITARDLAIYHYAGFLYTAKHWIENPDDLSLAFSFLDLHPAFWYLSRPEKYPNQWSTSGGTGHIWQHVQKSNGKTVVMLEAGGTVPGHYSTHYHDHKMDVYAGSFDEAYITMAKNVHRYFYLNGSPREILDN